nr:hypothetical protein [Tanacetum cinerariifolium]
MGYEHFNTTLVTELDEVALVLKTSYQSHDDIIIHEDDVPIEESKVFSNTLFDNDKINSDKLESHVESNFVEFLSNHDALIDSSPKIGNLEEFSGPLIPIHIAEEERIRREHAEYISQLHVDNSISNSENELSDNEASDFDNPSIPRPPPKPPDAKLDSRDGISVVMNTIVEFECLYPRNEFDVSNDENDDFYSFMFVICSKVFSFLLSAESEDTIFDPGFTPHSLKFLVFGVLSRSARASHIFFEISLEKSISLINIA